MNHWMMKFTRLGVAFAAVATVTTPLPVHAAQAQTLTWMVPEDPLIDKYANAVATAFEKNHPGVTVKVITPGSAAYDQKLLTLVAAGQTPDVFTDWGNTGVYTILSHHLAANLSPYFKTDKISTSYIPAAYQKEFSQNGQLYAVPWNSNPNFLVYNKDLFQKYHVPLPPTDWNDKSWTTAKLLQDAKLLTHNTGNVKTQTWGAVLNPGSIGSLGWLWGADPLNNKGGPKDTAAYTGAPITQTYLTQPGMVSAIQWLADLTVKYHVSPDQGQLQALSTYGNAFFSGRIGIDEVPGGWLERQAAVAKPNFHWGIAPLPYGPAGVNIGQRQDNAFYVSSNSANSDLAFRLVVFATDGWGAYRLINLAKDNPPHTGLVYFHSWLNDVSQIPGLAMTQKDFSSVFLGGIQRDFPDPTNLINDASDFANAFKQSISPVLLGKESAQTGLQTIQSAWQKYLSH